MANNRIGCSSGKTKLIDPNNFYGQDSSNNMSVPLEDLTISVQLTTNKKGRTVLSSNNNTNTAQSSNTVKVTFIEGTEVNGQKVLTSKFTDLTTVFDKDTPNSSSENLGITNIDIDFNSSYAPMVTINFIDLRGSSIFQNEAQLNNSENKYSVFFQLPYPLYELTIKGYYGKPVKYCLHMTKFNSKFNSQTGNFEITANFIGYTYAMLSDMLLGILKAIPYTKRGIDKYKDSKVLNLNDLMVKITQIDSNLDKIGASDPNAAKLKLAEEMLEKLTDIKNRINQLGQEIDYNQDLTGEDAYRYIVQNDSTTEAKTKLEQGKVNYNKDITVLIEAYNKLEGEVKAGAGLTYSYFLTNNATKSLTSNIQVFYNENFNTQTKVIINVSDRKSKASNVILTIFSMTPLFSELDKARSILESELKNLKLTLGSSIKESITKSLSFQPTVRNIVEVFTNAVEIFLAIIYEVSTEAETSSERKSQLNLAFKKNGNNGNSDLKSATKLKFYPWPDYRVNESNQGYVEKYLGAPGVLKNWRAVHELVFIDDLYNAFLTAKKVGDEAILQQQQGGATWIPTNPFDTKIYNNKEPYGRLINTTVNDIISLMLIRMVTFMGYTHDESLIDSNVIKTIAKAEANAFLRAKNLNGFGKTGVVAAFNSALQNNNFDSIIKTKNTINGVLTNIIEESQIESGYYTYTYIGRNNIPDGTKEFRFIPIKDSFSGEWPTNLTDLQLKKTGNDSKFLSNYTRSESSSSIGGKKLDGAWYVDIMPLSKFETSGGKGLIDTIEGTPPTDIIKLTDLKANKGYSLFSGPYGIQEFKNMDYGTKLLENAPIKYLFYKEKLNDVPYGPTDNDGRTKLLTNFISYGRKSSYTNQPHDITNPNTIVSTAIALSPVLNIPGVTQVATPLTIQPISYNGPKTIQIPDEVFNASNSGAPIKYPRSLKMVKNGYYAIPLHSNESDKYIENNRYMLNLYNDSATQNKLSYPYIEMQLFDGSDYKPFSLFGSKLYYNQKGSSVKESKGFLFLNTLPFVFPFETDEIINLFNKTGGFIHAPRLWCAWVGGIIWRAGLNTDNPNGKAQPWKDPIDIPYDGNNKLMYRETTDRFHYLMEIRRSTATINQYPKSINGLLIYLPQQILDGFYEEFYQFIYNGTWDELRFGLELVNETNIEIDKIPQTFNNIINGIYSEAYPSSNTKGTINIDRLLEFNNIEIENGKIKSDIYEIVIPVYEFAKSNGGNNDALFLELKGDYSNNSAVKALLDALNEEVVIANSGYGVWVKDAKKLGEDSITNENHQNILVKTSFVNEYLKNMAEVIKTYDETKDKESRQNKQDVFGTENDEIIKLQLYRTCKNVYDKWVGNAPNGENVIFQCGGSGERHTTDKHMAQKRGSDTPKLIDSFRFVTRSFRDIGDDFFVDPRPIGTYLTDNPNSSFYDAITNLLAANNFDFIALPSFINYNDKKTLESIFETYTYEEAVKGGICGPSFVCVYIGQKSKHLDFKGSEYDNDGFDIQCNGGSMKPGLPTDFTNTSKDYENDVAVFKVAYSQQNQNIFKDIILDQSEFTETEESLKIIDDISKTGSENQRHFGGQNLYSVYGVRSYKTEVEMMGNAMIQPMMYFQLDNIPMFHGAYLITHVKHSIKPNYMSTNFTGVRVRHPETPILDAAELYMSLIENINITATNTTPSTSCSSRGAKPTITCGSVKKNTVYSFVEVLQIVVDNLEGAYCKGGVSCGDKPNDIRSGETLWGLDKKNFGTGGIDVSEFNKFWTAVKKENKKKWDNCCYPKPKDKPELFKIYVTLIEDRYNDLLSSKANKNLKNYSEIVKLVNSDGRLLLNLIYASFNGSGFFNGFFRMLNNAYDNGNTTSDALLKIFVDDRINCLKSSNPSYKANAKTLLSDSGKDIGKLVGLYC